MEQNNILGGEDTKKKIAEITEGYKKYILENVDKLKQEFSNEDALIEFKEKIKIIDEINDWCDEHHYTLSELRNLLRFL